MNSAKENSISRKTEISTIATITGWSFIVMFALGIFAEFFVRTRLIVWEDPSLTLSNIQASQGLYEIGILAFNVIIFLDVVVASTFYILFNKINKFLALLMASLRLVYVAIKGFAITGLLLANDTYNSASKIAGEAMESHAIQGIMFLKLHHYGFGVALIFFGLHLIALSILLFKSNKVAKFILWLAFFAGVGYTLHSAFTLFAVDYLMLRNITFGIFIIPMTFGELTLALWLWAKRKNLSTFL